MTITEAAYLARDVCQWISATVALLTAFVIVRAMFNAIRGAK